MQLNNGIFLLLVSIQSTLSLGNAYDRTELVTLLGKDFTSFYETEVNGEGLMIKGDHDGRCIFWGAYRSWTGINEWYLAPRVHLSVKFYPDHYRTCSRRDWRRRCVDHDYHPLPHGFWLDVVANGATRKVLEAVELKNPTDLQNIWVELPQGSGFGDIQDLEFRACGPYGGPTFELEIHRVEYVISYNYTR